MVKVLQERTMAIYMITKTTTVTMTITNVGGYAYGLKLHN